MRISAIVKGSKSLRHETAALSLFNSLGVNNKWTVSQQCALILYIQPC